MLADFKIIAEAFGPISSAFEKTDDLADAIDKYKPSPTEHRTPKNLTNLLNSEKAKRVAKINAHIDSENVD